MRIGNHDPSLEVKGFTGERVILTYQVRIGMHGEWPLGLVERLN